MVNSVNVMQQHYQISLTIFIAEVINDKFSALMNSAFVHGLGFCPLQFRVSAMKFGEPLIAWALMKIKFTSGNSLSP